MISRVQNELKLLPLLILIGISFKFYGINDHWRTRDHYNYGGAYTTATTRCLKETPLSVSKGVVHSYCERGDPHYYPNQQSTILFALWGLTELLGDHEWVYRIFFLVFSVLNIYLIYLVGREIWPTGERAQLAALFQAFFLGNIYFGTHPDFIGEPTVSWILLSALFALRGRSWLPRFFALAAGVTSWPGYITFGPLFVYSLIYKKDLKKTIFVGALSFGIAMATIMWLHQTTDIGAFLLDRLNPDYLDKQQTPKDFLLPFRYLKNVIVSHSRLLSPLFCVFAFYELIFNLIVPVVREGWARLRNDRLAQGVILCGGTGLIYSLVGYQFVMIHVFLYMLATPALALCCASFFSRQLQQAEPKPNRKWLLVLGLLFLIFYPYGIFQSNLTHDIFNSVLFVSSVVFFLSVKNLSVRTQLLLVTLVGFTNFSQMANYRNESDTEFEFCEQARKQFQATGQPVETHERWTMTKDLVYCRGIPILYK